MTKVEGVVAVSCNFLGGERSTRWIVEVDSGLRQPATNDMIEVDAYGHDMYDLSIDQGSHIKPTLLSFLCNAWLQRSMPRPKEGSRSSLTVVNYLDSAFGSQD